MQRLDEEIIRKNVWIVVIVHVYIYSIDSFKDRREWSAVISEKRRYLLA